MEAPACHYFINASIRQVKTYKVMYTIFERLKIKILSDTFDLENYMR